METSKNYKIFIVDDDVFCSNMYEQYLKQARYDQVHVFTSGVECLDHLHLQPQIILLDHNMESMSGFEVLLKIKRFDPNIYVVMVSAQEQIQTAVESLKYGAFDYIEKGPDVCDKIEKVLNKIDRVQTLLHQSKHKNLKRFLSLF